MILSGTIEPVNASNKDITWSIKEANNTGAVIDGNKLSVTDIGTNWGFFTVTAAINDGLANDTPFTEDFSISILRYNRGTKTVYLTINGGDDWGQQWMTSSDRDIRLRDFYNGQLKENTEYEITISGTLDTELQAFSINFINNPSGMGSLFVSRVWISILSAGSFSETVTVLTKTDENMAIYSEEAIIQLVSNYSSEYTLTELEDGRIKATISNLDIKIEEVTF